MKASLRKFLFLGPAAFLGLVRDGDWFVFRESRLWFYDVHLWRKHGHDVRNRNHRRRSVETNPAYPQEIPVKIHVQLMLFSQQRLFAAPWGHIDD